MFLDAARFLKPPLINRTFACRATKTSLRQGKYFFVNPGILETSSET